MEWQPIETAPKDGTVILLVGHAEDKVVAGFFDSQVQDDFKWVFLDPEADESRLNAFGTKRFPPKHWANLPTI